MKLFLDVSTVDYLRRFRFPATTTKNNQNAANRINHQPDDAEVTSRSHGAMPHPGVYPKGTRPARYNAPSASPASPGPIGAAHHVQAVLTAAAQTATAVLGPNITTRTRSAGRIGYVRASLTTIRKETRQMTTPTQHVLRRQTRPRPGQLPHPRTARRQPDAYQPRPPRPRAVPGRVDTHE